jgi:hypothetical protein
VLADRDPVLDLAGDAVAARGELLVEVGHRVHAGGRVVEHLVVVRPGEVLHPDGGVVDLAVGLGDLVVPQRLAAVGELAEDGPDGVGVLLRQLDVLAIGDLDDLVRSARGGLAPEDLLPRGGALLALLVGERAGQVVRAVDRGVGCGTTVGRCGTASSRRDGRDQGGPHDDGQSSLQRIDSWIRGRRPPVTRLLR